MSKLGRYAPWIVLGTGTLTLLGTELANLEGWALLAAALVGAVLTFVGILVEEWRAGQACGGERPDRHRAGHVGFVVLGALLVSTLLVLLFTGVRVEAENVLAVAALVGLLAFQGSLFWQRRTA